MTDQPANEAHAKSQAEAATVARLLLELQARVGALENWRAVQSDLLDDQANGATAAYTGSAPTGPAEQDDAGDHEADEADDDDLDADRLVGWVHRHVAAVIARPLRGEVRWCPLWWEHPEAVFRFEALRRAWTQLAPEPGVGMSTWIRDHLDPCLRELLSPLGPFADCTHNERFHRMPEHNPLPTLPTEAPNPGTLTGD